MLLGDKEKTIKLHAENFLIGNITFDYGLEGEERMLLAGGSKDLAGLFLKWLEEDKQNNKSEQHAQTTETLYRSIVSWRIRGRIKGKLIDIDLEQKIEDLLREKIKLEEDIKGHKKSGLEALNLLKDQDRQMALLEAQIFYLKQGKSSGN